MLERLSVHFALKSRDPVGSVSRLCTQIVDSPSIDNKHIDTLSALIRGADDDVLTAMDPVLKARAIQKLSKAATFSINKYGHMPMHIKDAGLKLTLATPVPESMMTFFEGAESKMLGHLHAMVFGQDVGKRPNFNADMLVSAKAAKTFAGDFLDHFADAYNLEKGIKLQTSHDPKGGYGLAFWDKALDMPVVDANLAHVSNLKDVVKLVVTLGHEAMHTLNRTVHKTPMDWEAVRKTWPDGYVYMAVTDPLFYTTERPAYTRHPEEIFVERVGLRLGYRFAQMMGLKPDIHAFAKESLGVLTANYDVVRELAKLSSRKGDTPLPIGSGRPVVPAL